MIFALGMVATPVNVGEEIFAYFEDNVTPPSKIDLPTFKNPLNELSPVEINVGAVAVPKNDGFEIETLVFNCDNTVYEKDGSEFTAVANFFNVFKLVGALLIKFKTLLLTNSVVATCVFAVKLPAVGAVGIPVNEGEFLEAYLEVNETPFS